jgi:hypothetical protein|tara:strand:+ start:729 stop:959 length:231 start_codon:yes stop_codon:yes gene_type:complete
LEVVEEEITPRTCRDDDEKETEDGTLFPTDDSDDSDDDDEADIPESARMCVVYLPLNIIIAPLLVGVTRSALWSTF